MIRAQELDIHGPLPILLKHPAFTESSSLWIKENTHPEFQTS